MESKMNGDSKNEDSRVAMLHIGIAADHGGFELKMQLTSTLKNLGYNLIDFGAYVLEPDDDYPDFVIPMVKALVNKDISLGIAVCGSGVGACITANKVPGIRAALIAESFSAHQGVEDDNMNVMCLGGRITGYNLALELVLNFLNASFKAEARFIRRLDKITLLENENNQ